MSKCSHSSCDRKAVVRGFCMKHYQRHWNRTPGFVRRIYNNPKQRFLSQLRLADNGKCLLWAGTLDKDGYGRFFANGKTMAAHRYYYTNILGLEIPDGNQMSHNCTDHGAEYNNKSCVLHCIPATQSDNIRMDAAGELHGQAVVPDWLLFRAVDFYLMNREEYSMRRLANLLTAYGYPTSKATVCGWINRTGRTAHHSYDKAFGSDANGR